MLTGPQQQTLKTFIANTSALNSFPNTLDGAWEIATLLNLVVTPDFIVCKTNVAIDEIMRNGMDWARVDNLSVGKARIWEWMTKLNTINAAKPNIRAGIDAAWVGTAARTLLSARLCTSTASAPRRWWRSCSRPARAVTLAQPRWCWKGRSRRRTCTTPATRRRS